MYAIMIYHNVKYSFLGFSLRSYCKWAKIQYEYVLNGIRYCLHSEKYKNWSLEEIIYYSIQKRLKRKAIRKVQNTFYDLLENIFTIEEVCCIFHISKSFICKARRYGFSIQQSILLIYFFGDIYFNEEKRISNLKIKEVKMKIQKEEYGEDLAELFGFYYLGANVTNTLYDKMNKRFTSTIYKLSHIYGVNVSNSLFDILQEIQCILWRQIKKNRICLANSQQISAYCYKCVIFKIYSLLNHIKKESIQNHLEDIMYDDKCFGDFVYKKQEFDYLF